MANNITVAWKSEKGRRSANEDSCLVLRAEELPPGIDGLYVVADGMGGRASGAMASSTAVSTVRESFVTRADTAGRSMVDILARCLSDANSAVHDKAGTKPELEGMGTTCVAVAIREGIASYAHLGDSRAYLLREGEIRRLTEDHSFVAEKVRSGEITEDQAKKSRFRNIITKAIGLEPAADPETG